MNEKLSLEKTVDQEPEPTHTVAEGEKKPGSPKSILEEYGEIFRKKLRDPNDLPDFMLLNMCLEKAKLEGGEEWRRWQAFFREEGKQVYEIFTREYIRRLSGYLAEEVDRLHGTKNSPVVILECAAGDGRLTHFLQEQMDKLCPGKARVIATDAFAGHEIFPVEELDAKEAIEKYHPQIVIISWMPNLKDFTDTFRADPHVQEYILIGEGPGGACGRDWETWGLASDRSQEGKIPPYQADGFIMRQAEEDMTRVQLSSNRDFKGKNSSTTYIFSRKPYSQSSPFAEESL